MADRATATTNRSNDTARSVDDDLAALRADLKALRDSISDLAYDTRDEVRAKISETADRAVALGKQKAETMQETVRERPMTSVAIAFGVGMLIAHLLDRR